MQFSSANATEEFKQAFDKVIGWLYLCTTLACIYMHIYRYAHIQIVYAHTHTHTQISKECSNVHGAVYQKHMFDAAMRWLETEIN